MAALASSKLAVKSGNARLETMGRVEVEWEAEKRTCVDSK